MNYDVVRLAAWAVLALTVLWAVVGLLERRRRAAYNLTVGEQARGAKRPDFLKVDHAARERAMRPGAPAAAVEAPAERSTLSRVIGLVTTLMAVATLLAAVVNAMSSVPSYSQAVSDALALVTDPAALAASFRAHWTGIIVAAVIVLAQFGRFVTKFTRA